MDMLDGGGVVVQSKSYTAHVVGKQHLNLDLNGLLEVELQPLIKMFGITILTRFLVNVPLAA